MDLLGIDLKEKREKAKVTILQRWGGTWESLEVKKLVHNLQPIGVVHQHPEHPEFLMIMDEHADTAVMLVIGCTNYSHEVMLGLDNPRLPFPVPII